MELIQVIKALGDETRIRILNLLRKQDMCVCEIESILGINQSNASRHLIKLKAAKLISSEKKAQWVYHKINSHLIEEYPFVQEILDKELDKIAQCQEDLKALEQHNASGITCEAY